MRGRVAAVETLPLAAGGGRALPALVGAIGTVSLPVTHQAEVQAVFSDGAVSLHTRSLKYGKVSWSLGVLTG